MTMKFFLETIYPHNNCTWKDMFLECGNNISDLIINEHVINIKFIV